MSSMIDVRNDPAVQRARRIAADRAAAGGPLSEAPIEVEPDHMDRGIPYCVDGCALALAFGGAVRDGYAVEVAHHEIRIVRISPVHGGWDYIAWRRPTTEAEARFISAYDRFEAAAQPLTTTASIPEAFMAAAVTAAQSAREGDDGHRD